jgi:uncharacterized iron-regulated membrane protein
MVDQYSGRIVAIEDPIDANGVTRAFDEWSFPVHSGSFGGDVTRVLWFVLGLTPLLLAWTGVVMWLTRRRRRRRTAPAPSTPTQEEAARP